MKRKKKLIAMLLLGAAVGLSVLAFGGCSEGEDKPSSGTDITDPNVPLTPGGCKHTEVNHVSALKPTCEKAGNKEYWFCADCGKYFADAEMKVETSLAGVTLSAAGHSYGNLISETSATCEKTGIIAHYHCDVCNSDFDADKKSVTDLVIPVASHTYGGWIDETPATCLEDGVKGHKDCTDCKKHFDADNKVITDLVIASGHAYGELIAEVPAVGCNTGVKAHYHCDVCNTDFDENKEEFNGLPFPIGNGLMIIPAPHNIKDYPAEEASCIVDGHGAYRQCEDCEQYFDAFGNVSFDEPIFISGTHSYGEFVYDFATRTYVKTCKHDSTHTVVQEAGVEGYPYRANDIETLNVLLGNFGGHIILEADINYDGYIIADSAKPTVLDLNGHTITDSAWSVFWVGIDNAPVITVKNGNIAADDKAFYTGVNSEITLENVNITKSVFGIYASAGTFNVIGGEINATQNAMQIYSAKYYADYNIKPEKREDYDAVVNISGATIQGTGIGLNLRSVYATVEDTVIDTTNTCVIVYRDCNLTMTGCTIKSEKNCGVQGNGTKLSSSYNTGIDTVIELNDCTIEAKVGIYHPQIDGKLTVNGGSITGTDSAIEMRAGEAELNNVQLISTAESFSAEANKSGSTTQGVALAVSQHTTDDNIIVTVNGCTLSGIYAIFEKDLMDDKVPKDITINIDNSGSVNTFNGYVYSENCENIVNTADSEGNAVVVEAA